MSEDGPVRHRHARQESGRLLVWRKYRFELIGLLAVGLGLFLVVEQMSLRASLAAWAHRAARGLFSGLQQFDDGLDLLLARISFSDALGVLLVAGAVVAILLRIRWRLLNSPTLTTANCPRCGGPIHRIHRTRLDRLVCAYVPVRRYRCRSADCRWRGLRVGKHQESTPRHAPAQG